MMTSQVLRALEERGLVVAAGPSGRRAGEGAEVTPEGRALANAAVVDVEACDRAFFAALGAGVSGIHGDACGACVHDRASRHVQAMSR